MTLVWNYFSSPAAGTAISTSNGANADGSTGWNQVNIPTSATLTPDTTKGTPTRGTQALKVATGSTAGLCYCGWTESIAPFSANPTSMWYSWYVYLTANPSSTWKVFVATGSTNGFWGQVVILTSGKLSILNSVGTTQATSTATVPLNRWVRIEHFQHAPASGSGSLTAQMFNGQDDTPIEAALSGTLASGASALQRTRLGIGTSTAHLGPFWVAGFQASSDGPVDKVPVANAGMFQE